MKHKTFIIFIVSLGIFSLNSAYAQETPGERPMTDLFRATMVEDSPIPGLPWDGDVNVYDSLYTDRWFLFSLRITDGRIKKNLSPSHVPQKNLIFQNNFVNKVLLSSDSNYGEFVKGLFVEGRIKLIDPPPVKIVGPITLASANYLKGDCWTIEDERICWEGSGKAVTLAEAADTIIEAIDFQSEKAQPIGTWDDGFGNTYILYILHELEKEAELSAERSGPILPPEWKKSPVAELPLPIPTGEEKKNFLPWVVGAIIFAALAFAGWKYHKKIRRL